MFLPQLLTFFKDLSKFIDVYSMCDNLLAGWLDEDGQQLWPKHVAGIVNNK
jgi:hypothetical protein